MSFDPEQFGKAMGEAIQRAVEPLRARIDQLEKQLFEIPTPVDGKDGADGRDGESVTLDDLMPTVEKAVDLIRTEANDAYQKALDELPTPKDGKDGADGRDGESVTLDDLMPTVEKAVDLIRTEANDAYQKALDELPTPKDGKDGADGRDGADGAKGDPGKDGADIADLMIDRAGELVATLTDGRMKNLGPVIGMDGKDGKDGQDGIGLDDFEIEYDAGNHEVVIRASSKGRTKELRYPAGGIHAGGYWRDGNQAKAGQAWTHDGSMWVALRDTKEKPSAQSGDWVLAARKGRDGERGPRGRDAAPEAPIKLGGGNESGND